MTSLTAHQLISVDGKISVHGKENSKPTENTNAASASNLLQSDLKRTQNETQKKINLVMSKNSSANSH